MKDDRVVKILFMLPRPNLGGASQVLLNLLNGVGQMNSIEPSFCFEELGPSLPEYRTYGKWYVFPLTKQALVRKACMKLSAGMYNHGRYWYARWLIRWLNPEIIYVNSLTASPSVKAAFASSRRVWIHAHEMDFLVTMNLPDAWLRDALAQSEKLITCSYAVANFYERTYQVPFGKITVLHGPVSSERLFKTKNALAVRPSDGSLVLGVVANLSFLKGPDLLIEALSLLINERGLKRNVRLKWLGAPAAPNSYLSSIQNLVERLGLKEQIIFLPASPDTDLFYASIDIFLLPSRTEAFPLCILEAMLFEKPVVAMDVGGVREMVNSETGYLVKDRSPEGFAEGILYFVDSEERRRQAGLNGRKRVLENFESKVQAPKWLQIFEKI